MNNSLFLEHVRQRLGYAPLPESVIPGKLVRFATNEKHDDKAGWLKPFLDGQGGVYGDFRQGISESWQAHEARTPEEREKFRQGIEQAKAEAKEQEGAERARAKAALDYLWGNAGDASPQHPYITMKNIQPYGIRQQGDNLLIPVKTIEGILQGVQMIGPDGGKQFKSGSKVQGNFHLLGEPDGKILIAEGYATGASIHAITGMPVAVAFNAGNLKPVAEALRTKHPDAIFIVCADDDYLKPSNPGLKAATEAAKSIGGFLAIPVFPTARGANDTDFNDLARLEGGEAVRKCIEAAPKTEAVSSRIRVVNAIDFMSLTLPPRENILSPWLPRQGLAMIYAPRGVGKTFVSLSIAYAVSSGCPFFSWNAPVPRGVLFIDGEMPASVLQERLAKISVSNDLEPVAPLQIITPDLQSSGMIDLTRSEDQAELQKYLGGVELVIIDNLSTLCRTGKENEGEGWLPVQEWALQQRATGRSVLFIHHAGKNGEQRGTSRREDVLDTVISLKRPGDYTPDKGACFEVHFEKSRGIYGDETKPFEAQLTTMPDGRLSWLTKPLEESTTEKVAKLLNEGIPQNEIADMLRLSKGTISKARKRATERGLLTP